MYRKLPKLTKQKREDILKKSLLCLTALLSLHSVNSMAINKVVYGEDNRIDISDSSKKFLLDSVAAMLPNSAIATDSKGKTLDSILTSYPTLETYRGYRTCEDMRFRTEPTIASCSGFLIGKNLLMTAGHCVVPGGKKVINAKTSGCASNKWVFNYNTSEIASDGTISIAKSNVYGCKRVVSGSYTGELDYAVIELDREAADKTPVKMNFKPEASAEGVSVYVAGHPTGLPLKVSAGAKVVYNSNRLNQFETNLDTFAGNSGSPVFNAKDEVVGILVAGEIDYAYNYDKNCYEVNRCEGYGKKCDRQSRSSGGLGETVTKIGPAHYDYTLSKLLGELKFDASENK